MNPLVLAARESRNVLRSFWRNRSGTFFTILLPVMFLLLFGAINRGGTVQLDPHGPQIGYTTFFTPGMLGMAIMAGTFVSLAISLTVMRDDAMTGRRLWRRRLPHHPRRHLLRGGGYWSSRAVLGEHRSGPLSQPVGAAALVMAVLALLAALSPGIGRG